MFWMKSASFRRLSISLVRNDAIKKESPIGVMFDSYKWAVMFTFRVRSFFFNFDIC